MRSKTVEMIGETIDRLGRRIVDPKKIEHLNPEPVSLNPIREVTHCIVVVITDQVPL